MTDTAPDNPAREHTPLDEPCDECGAAPGEACLPHCTAPFGPGGPHEFADPADDDTPGARPDPVPRTPTRTGDEGP